MQPMQLSSVVLPEPLGPLRPTTWPGYDLEMTPAQRIHAGRSRAEMLGDVDELDAASGCSRPFRSSASAAAGSTLSASRTPSCSRRRRPR